MQGESPLATDKPDLPFQSLVSQLFIFETLLYMISDRLMRSGSQDIIKRESAGKESQRFSRRINLNLFYHMVRSSILFLDDSL